MKKFQKKPIIVDAFQVTVESLDGLESNKDFYPDSQYRYLIVRVGASEQIARIGDWVITDVFGAYHICPNSIFHRLYEEIVE